MVIGSFARGAQMARAGRDGGQDIKGRSFKLL
jgi:hypothetical protein